MHKTHARTQWTVTCWTLTPSDGGLRSEPRLGFFDGGGEGLGDLDLVEVRLTLPPRAWAHSSASTLSPGEKGSSLLEGLPWELSPDRLNELSPWSPLSSGVPVDLLSANMMAEDVAWSDGEGRVRGLPVPLTNGDVGAAVVDGGCSCCRLCALEKSGSRFLRLGSPCSIPA